MTTTRPPLWRTWLATRILFFLVLAPCLLVVGLTAVGSLTGRGDSGSIRCPDGTYPASNAAEEHTCFPNGEAPDRGFSPDPMEDHQRD